MFRHILNFNRCCQLEFYLTTTSKYHLYNCRDSFTSKFGAPKSNAWYPGHMYKGILQMQAKLAVVDCIIEVHDARIPFSGRNPKFYSMLTAIRPHILVLNKSDTIEYAHRQAIKDRLLKDNVQNVLFTNCKTMKKSGVEKIIPTVLDIVDMAQNYGKGIAASFTVMVIGIPNVGKSSIINKMRNIHLKKKNASIVGAVPGITKSVLEKIKISANPLVYLFDTPGVVQPKIDDVEVGLRLALCRTLREDIVGEPLIADYLLYFLNKTKNYSYVEVLKMDEPTDDIRIVLIHISREFDIVHTTRNLLRNIETRPDFQRSSLYFIKCFREGKFGKVLLDIDYLNKKVS